MHVRAIMEVDRIDEESKIKVHLLMEMLRQVIHVTQYNICSNKT